MFEGYYTFRKANVDTPFQQQNKLRTHIYTFKTEKAPYIVHVEEYPESIYIIKFFRKVDRHRHDRFNILTNEGRCTRIVTTCIMILISILKKVPEASFGFLGANTETRTYTELKSDTQRFNIYKFAMENKIGDSTFTHAMDVTHSTYLMVNKKVNDTDKFIERAKSLFEEIYPQLEV